MRRRANGASSERHLYVPPLRRQQLYYAIAFISPALAIYLVFMLYPFINTIYLSLTNWNGATTQKDFIGLANYARMFGDGAVLQAFWNNMIWVIIGTIAPVAIGLFLALLLWSGARGSVFFRTVYFLPFVLPLVVVAIVWQWIYHPIYGPLNKMLDSIGLRAAESGLAGRAEDRAVRGPDLGHPGGHRVRRGGALRGASERGYEPR